MVQVDVETHLPPVLGKEIRLMFSIRLSFFLRDSLFVFDFTDR
jgi:hypothetical protein